VVQLVGPGGAGKVRGSKLRRAIASIPIAGRAAISLFVLFAVSMLTGLFAVAEEASTPAALLFLVAGLSSFGLLGVFVWFGASWAIQRASRDTKETARVTFEPFRREPAGANDRVEIGFDGSTFAAGPPNRPIVLALKNVANGPHALRVKTTLDNREDTFESTVKIIDVADFYHFDVVDRTPSVGLIQSSLVLQKLERAGVALPVCSTLPAGASVR
jgi:hypothetical protein